MATFKVKLDTRRQKQDGTYPLTIRIYNGDKYRDIGLGFSVLKSQFDEREGKWKVKSSHPNAKSLNLAISKKLHEVKEATLKLQVKDEMVTADRIKNSIVKPTPKYDFLQYGWKTVEGLKQLKKDGNANIYRDALNALVIHSKRQSIEFKELSHAFLLQLESKMIQNGLMVNSISVYFRTIRAIFNRAIKEGVVEKRLYPFDDFKIKSEATVKRSIGIGEMQLIANAVLELNSQEQKARDFFLLSFNLIGMSFADIATIKPSDVTNGRLVYKRKKTHKIYNIKLTQKAKAILDAYQQLNNSYILPIVPESAVGNTTEERKYIQYSLKICNKYLKRVGERLELQQELTTYVARHSWATIAKKKGYSKDLISEALGHSYGNRITEIYLDSFDQEVIDEMNEKICDI